MVWGAAAKPGIDDWVRKMAANDPSLTSLHILRFRRFGPQEVEALCGALAANTVLHELYASGHALTPDCVARFAQLLRENGTLRSLCVGDAQLGDEGAAALAEGLRGNKGLQKLDLFNKSLGPAGAAALRDALPHAAALSHLQVSGNPSLGDEGLAALLPVGERCALATLEACDCGVTDKGAQRLAAYLASPECSLGALVLGGNPLGPQGASALAGALSSNNGNSSNNGDGNGSGSGGSGNGGCTLATLSLANTGAGDDGAAALAAALAPNKGNGRCGSGSNGSGTTCALRSLDLGSCGIGPVGAAALGRALASSGCAPLTRLALAGNPALGSAGVAALAGGGADDDGGSTGSNNNGSVSSSLRGLDVGGCKGPLGEAELRLLSALPALRALSLFDSGLGDAGAEALAALLLQESSSSSRAGGTGGEAAAAAAGAAGDGGSGVGAQGLRPFPELEELDVAGNGISEEGLRALLRALRDGAAPKLKVIVIGGNPGATDALTDLLDEVAAARPGLDVARSAAAGEA